MRIEPDEVMEAVVRGWPFAWPSWLGDGCHRSGDEPDFAETPMEVDDCDLMFDDDVTIVDEVKPTFPPPAQPAIWSPTA